MNSLEMLAMARGLLSDVRYSIVVRKSECKSCGSARYDNFINHQIRECCQSAIARIDKAVSMLESQGEKANDTQAS